MNAEKKESARSRDIARAALLRERIIGALRANVDGMTAKALCDYSSISELYHGAMLPGRVQAQLSLLMRSGVIERVGIKPGSYFLKRKREEDQPVEDVRRTLHLEVSRSQHTISFVFEGFAISVKVLP